MKSAEQDRWAMGGKISYWIAGLPIALRNASLRGPTSLDRLRHEYAARYFSTADKSARRMRKVAMLLTLPWLAALSFKFTALNGRMVKARHGRSIRGQLSDQLSVYRTHGILPRWYYIFSLYEPGGLAKAAHFLNRFETKSVYFRLLNKLGSSPLDDKVAFAAHCRDHGLPHVAVLAFASQGEFRGDLESSDRGDLFIKPIRDRGGKGAERWTRTSEGYIGPAGIALTPAQLQDRLERESRASPRLVQPRAINHPAMADLSNGALTTIRVLSCLDEQGQPEIIGAVLRMAVGSNDTVDNFHAGGIAAPVALDTGELGPASNLGDNVSLGWLSRHPDTDGQIEGRTLPLWPQLLDLVRKAHLAFADRIVVGWDVAILVDGPVLLEGNSGPDVDIMQRMVGCGIGQGRFPDLIAHNLAKLNELTSAN